MEKNVAEVVAALIWDGDRFMICQRPAHKARGLLWEFVGGKVEPGETKEQALSRECREELDVAVSVGSVFMEVDHDYPDLNVHLTLFNAAISEGVPQMLEHNDIRWITPEEIPQYEFCPADETILKKLRLHVMSKLTKPENVPQSVDAYRSIRGYVIEAQRQVYTAVNSAMVTAYWKIGKSIFEACGENDRAAYGKQVLLYISERLTEEFGKGFDISNLRNMRRFYLTFPIQDALRPELSWTHYRSLMRVGDTKARTFYMEECAKAGWSSRQMERQINTMFYQRLLASRDKESVAAEIQTTEPKPEYEQIIKDPYVLEFLDLPANEHFYESSLEQALIDHLQKFLLELGRGFSFVARQKHFNVDGQHFYIDLVFYNYILKCFVLIDLKTGDLTHQDIGQMQMYVNYYTRYQMNEGDNPPVGLLLCAQKSDTLVQLTLPEDNRQIYAAKYMPYLPTEEELKRELNLKEFEKLEGEID